MLENLGLGTNLPQWQSLALLFSIWDKMQAPGGPWATDLSTHMCEGPVADARAGQLPPGTPHMSPCHLLTSTPSPRLLLFPRLSSPCSRVFLRQLSPIILRSAFPSTLTPSHLLKQTDLPQPSLLWKQPCLLLQHMLVWLLPHPPCSSINGLKMVPARWLPCGLLFHLFHRRCPTPSHWHPT